MSTRARRFAKQRGGVAIVEFTLVLGVLLLLFAGLVEMANFWWQFRAATNCVTDAARYLARSYDPAQGASALAISYADDIAACQAPPVSGNASTPMRGVSNVAAQIVYDSGPALRYGGTSVSAIVSANFTYKGVGLLRLLFPSGVVSVSISHKERGGMGS